MMLVEVHSFLGMDETPFTGLITLLLSHYQRSHYETVKSRSSSIVELELSKLSSQEMRVVVLRKATIRSNSNSANLSEY